MQAAGQGAQQAQQAQQAEEQLAFQPAAKYAPIMDAVHEALSQRYALMHMLHVRPSAELCRSFLAFVLCHAAMAHMFNLVIVIVSCFWYSGPSIHSDVCCTDPLKLHRIFSGVVHSTAA